ncbi:aminopeptidase N [Sulfuricella denitrificans skB26]|uniref:Aminopeptidase N n=1 Tax=Sulfuricella denitrificans (strain DSM 22764 / NBRC 105220 / skB26) TaxID=1163617 RepID=S6AAM2_SULDS|nr:aminopeptidase N [Sulfuricella denitrificans]BAN33868.1 aminopeptidase N [Sulfuricella denitrificans skB26]
MTQDTPQTINLADYAPPSFLIDTVDVDVDFRRGEALVTVQLSVRRNPAVKTSNDPLVLDGEDLELISLRLDGVHMAPDSYHLDAGHLTLADLPDAFSLETVTRIHPDGNTRLSGLYLSANGYFTQCEAQGFRRITWFLDRPDVMSRYTVTLHADKAAFPQLLANGNPVASGDEEGGRHWAKWQDPFPKPCYLFAMVAAKLDVLRDNYRTTSGREVQLAIFVEPGKLDQCAHAMSALKKSMHWDEQTFGLECDLDHYMIVAVGDFNMGAMENKGLNIFNTKYVLARQDVATDVDYENIDRVVAHEYFHNWTGNRVTCRDWFQLSLKEGLTVFRDQEFGADVHHRSVARIREVRGLRAAQFPEDSGPMAHPVRPASYIEINNFYTATVYQKGAEVVRMIQTLIGKPAFRRGMDLYFARHDGQAVTCDNFVVAMADASGADFSQFMRWYEQTGTPHVAATGRYDAASQRYILRLSQSCAATPGQADKQLYHIPVAIGLVGPDGQDLPLRLAGDDSGTPASQIVLSLCTETQEFIFEDVPVAPVPSLLRDFSAPIVLEYAYSDADLAHLMAHDSDPFNRWEAGQRLANRLIIAATATLSTGGTPIWPASFAQAAARVLADADTDPAFAAEALSLPSEATLAEQLDVVDPDALHAARNGLRRFLTEHLGAEFLACYERLAPRGGYRPDLIDVGHRTLRNVCLSYLCEADSPSTRALARQQFDTADNMTDQFASLMVLAQSEGEERQQALDAFYQQWQGEALVVDKWLQVQATSRRPSVLNEVKRLVEHPAFDLRNPNKVYSLLRAFGSNHVHFHAADGSGYRFLAEQTRQLDAVNPQVASRVARCFDRWRKFDASRQAHARAALEMLRNHAGMSRDLFEIVDRQLG